MPFRLVNLPPDTEVAWVGKSKLQQEHLPDEALHLYRTTFQIRNPISRSRRLTLFQR